MVASTRREARERAIELLYEAEAKGVHPSTVVDELPLGVDEYARELAFGTSDHAIEIDLVLGRFAQRWSVSRMAAMDRTVLRLGVFELATQPEVPTGVCLSEAVDLGSQYGSTDDTGKFVNGILARVAEEIRGGQRPWMPIDVVVFDMDGVIRKWHGKDIAAFEAEHGLEIGAVAKVAFEQPLFHQATVGDITAQEWAAAIGRGLEEAHGVAAPAGTAMWLATDWTVDDDVVALIGGIRDAGQRTALFSNASTNLEADMERMGVADLFDVVANSSRIGLAKPDVAAFSQVATMIDADPHRLMFVDDRSENVVGCVEAGWHGVQMRDASRLAAVLARLGVPGVAAP